ncbi:glycosyltransferase family 2 protein [Methylovulum miyakonense]|uniref:glycosyltransferase family 2 protein n=1 Tax=Methylovulum miyakonense TaxID=645578 RepID=UPI000368DF25|nr:glycosyltransferase family 2 protein [Methylovulum miyakonense]
MLNIVIPMAGRGSRFAVAGYPDPKPLIPIENIPMIRWIIANLRPAQAHRFIFVCLEEHLQQYGLEEKLAQWSPGCKVVPVSAVTEGAACTVLLARDFIDNDDALMIANSDQWVDVAIDDYLLAMGNAQADGWIMTMTANDPKWSFLRFDDEGNITEVVEKQVVSNEATVGIYNFAKGSDFVRAADGMIAQDFRVNGEFYVAPVYNGLVAEHKKIGYYSIGSEADGMYGLGIPEDLRLFESLPIKQHAYAKVIS